MVKKYSVSMALMCLAITRNGYGIEPHVQTKSAQCEVQKSFEPVIPLLDITHIERQVPILDRIVEHQRLFALTARASSIAYTFAPYIIPAIGFFKLNRLFSKANTLPDTQLSAVQDGDEPFLSSKAAHNETLLPAPDAPVAPVRPVATVVPVSVGKRLKMWAGELFSVDTLKDISSYVPQVIAYLIGSYIMEKINYGKIDHNDDSAWFIHYYGPYNVILANASVYIKIHAADTNDMEHRRIALHDYCMQTVNAVDQLLVFIEHKAKRLLPAAATTSHSIVLYLLHMTNDWSAQMVQLLKAPILDYQALDSAFSKYKQQVDIEVERFGILEKQVAIKRLLEWDLF